ncbi:hypothetical protein [Nocardia fluminea]|uniref:hypothetical protein n=1 Tax=Nocardia fluminea TaxID=134984 RepID=UPI003418325C
MRYIDSGFRNPKDTLGAWLTSELIQVASPSALRVQTGFFGSDALGFLEDALTALGQANGHTRFLLGSNDGQTTRSAVADLLTVAGPPRTELRIGVVSFQSGYFHPKVFHIQRWDGSSTAYIGSANLTGSGTTSLHVEAGLILDDKQGDPSAVLTSIADRIDDWFLIARPGLYNVVDDSDLDPLVQANVLGVPHPPSSGRVVHPPKYQGTTGGPAHSLKPLVAAPPVKASLPSMIPASSGTSSGAGLPFPGASPTAPTPGTPMAPSKKAAAKHWGKKLSDSDAQRKKTGNQRGAITLVQGDYKRQIDQTVYFRTDLFGQQTWVPGNARTGQPIETTMVPMHVTIDGTYHGALDFEVTHGTSRQASQNNYTTELHTEPIGPIIRQTDISGKHLDVTLDINGVYWLTIG